MTREQELRDQLDEAQERIIQLESLLGARFDFPPSLGLSPRESEVLGLLLKNEIVSYELYESAVMYDRFMASEASDIFQVYVCKLRQKLGPHGITISNLWSRGFYLNPASRQKLNALLDPETQTGGGVQ